MPATTITADQVVQRARAVLIEFDIDLIEDERLWTELGDEDLRLLEEIVYLNNPSFPLPGDSSTTINKTGGNFNAAGYSLPAGPTPPVFWRPRAFAVVKTGGKRVEGQFVPAAYRYQVPDFQPSAYILADKIRPVDGQAALEADLKYGWLNSTDIELSYVTKPGGVVDAESALGCPDECLPYLGYWLAWFQATRAKPGTEIVGQIAEKLTFQKQRLTQTVRRYGGPNLLGRIARFETPAG